MPSQLPDYQGELDNDSICQFRQTKGVTDALRSEADRNCTLCGGMGHSRRRGKTLRPCRCVMRHLSRGLRTG